MSSEIATDKASREKDSPPEGTRASDELAAVKNEQAHEREQTTRKYGLWIVIGSIIAMLIILVVEFYIFNSNEHIKDVLDTLKTVILFVLGYLFATKSTSG
ncbi:MAG: hypothetical protein LBS62_08905 [Clostridiales bacterium]|jgi:hypothetical protein|nr:hypothetical protein [Clostridiales bacterium]